MLDVGLVRINKTSGFCDLLVERMLTENAMAETYRTDHILGGLSSFESKNAPEELYLSGNARLLTENRRVAIVGSRKASAEGLARARSIARALVDEGIVVVSGLAEGIDTAAHEAAIEHGGKTIAVLGTPLSQAYPKSNACLLDLIRREHLAVSQFHEGHPPRRDNFPRRNRTMALLCDATIVVEASENSGTRHQGWEALRLGRVVYLLQNLVQNPDLTWPQEMLKYGAQVLRRDDLPSALQDIPSFTSGVVSAV